jgi:hypothetical protein
MSLPPRVMYHRSHAFESWYESAQYDNFTGEQVQPLQSNLTILVFQMQAKIVISLRNSQ